MKKIYLSILLISFFCNAWAQQWEWAVAADSVYGSQEAKIICRSGNILYALLYQHGSSIINNTYVDSGSVIIKLNTNGNILWAKQYPGTIEFIYAGKNGNVYFLGPFTDSLNFLGTLLISHGSRDIFFGLLDANTGNKLWANSAGGINDDWTYYNDGWGNHLITDNRENLFFTTKITGDFYVGSLYLSGYSGLSTYLLRCDLNGNLLQSFSDTIYNNSHYFYRGVDLQKSNTGTIYLNAIYDMYNCPYACDGNEIVKINPVNYSLNQVAHLPSYDFFLHSWTIDNDSTINTNYNTWSHYGFSYDLFHHPDSSQRIFRKGLGTGYDGKSTPCMAKGINGEIVFGGYYNNDFNYGIIDTLWFDNLYLLPDSLPNVMLGGINSANQFTWLLHSEGTGFSTMQSIISDEQGHIFCLGNYNKYGYFLNDSFPDPITFNNTTLPAENLYTRVFIAGATTLIPTSTNNSTGINNSFSLFPNPATSTFILHCPSSIVHGQIQIYNPYGEIIHQQIITSANQQINLSAQPKGIYFLEVIADNKRETRKIVLN